MSTAEMLIDNNLMQENRWLRQRLEDLQEKNGQLNLCAELSKYFLGNLSLRRNLDFLLEKVLQITKAKRVGVAILNLQENVKISCLTKTGSSFLEEDHFFKADLPLLDYALSQEQAIIFNERNYLPQNMQEYVNSLPFLALPLKLDDNMLGLLFVEKFFPLEMAEDYLHILRELVGPTFLVVRNALFWENFGAQQELYNKNLVATYQGITENLGQGILAIDKNGIITIFNSELERIFGTGAMAFIGKKFTTVFEKIDYDFSYILESLEGKAQNNLHYNFNYQGKEIITRVRVKPIFNQQKEIIGGVSCWQDITQETKMYRGVAQIGQLAVVGQLAATVAHEIRNPLFAIRGLAQLTQMIPDAQEKEKKLGLLLQEVDHLDNIVKEWMDLSRKGKKQIEFTSINVKEMLEDLIRLLQGKMILTNITVTSHFSSDFPMIKGNKTLLKQAFLNILINSLQAMPEGGDIYLKGEFKKGDKKIKILIHDTGEGIAEKDLDSVFQPFFSNKEDGTGLGLPVVRQVIVEKHRGEMWLESKVGKGTTIFLELPLE